MVWVKVGRGALLFSGAFSLLAWTCPRPGRLMDGVSDPGRWVQRAGWDAVAGQLAGAIGWLVFAWLVTGVGLLAMARLPGVAGRFAVFAAARVLPAGVRRAAAVVLGLTLATTSTGVATAAGPATVSTRPAGGAAHGGWVAGPRTDAAAVDWPLTGAAADGPGVLDAAVVDWPLTRPTGVAARPMRAVVFVAPGDTLWFLAARRLGPDATSAEVGVEWRRWYGANRAAVGPDPARLHVGTLLVPPP